MIDLFNYQQAAPPDLPDGCPAEVASLFVRFAKDVKRRGFRRYSADAILHRIRWHMHIERGDREWKCNNNWTSGLARWAMHHHPAELSEFFETRERRAQEEIHA